MASELDVLVGEWEVDSVWEGEVVARTRATFEWIADGAFLMQRSETELTDTAPDAWRENAPRSGATVIGLDDLTGVYSYLYSDSRGVHRVHQMTLKDGEWRIWGQAGPEFFQRFIGTFSDDGRTIESRWERSTDGESWELDFGGAYTRL